MLLDPVTGRAAAYNSTHRTVTFDASPELVAYARAKGYKEVPYDESMQDPTGRWRPLPPWATAEVKARMVLIWTRSGLETDDELLAMPNC